MEEFKIVYSLDKTANNQNIEEQERIALQTLGYEYAKKHAKRFETYDIESDSKFVKYSLIV